LGIRVFISSVKLEFSVMGGRVGWGVGAELDLMILLILVSGLVIFWLSDKKLLTKRKINPPMKTETMITKVIFLNIF